MLVTFGDTDGEDREVDLARLSSYELAVVAAECLVVIRTRMRELDGSLLEGRIYRDCSVALAMVRRIKVSVR